MSRTPASGDKRIEILKSAAAAFRRRGYHGASVDEIASALEMTKGNLYYYFKNKEEILFACHEYSLDKLLALMSEVDSEPSSPDEKLPTDAATLAERLQAAGYETAAVSGNPFVSAVLGASRVATDAQATSAFDWLVAQMPGDNSYFPLSFASSPITLVRAPLRRGPALSRPGRGARRAQPPRERGHRGDPAQQPGAVRVPVQRRRSRGRHRARPRG